LCDTGTLVEKTQDSTMIVNSEVDTLIESNLGTMIINESDDDTEQAATDSLVDTMKRRFYSVIYFIILVICFWIFVLPPLFDLLNNSPWYKLLVGSLV